MRASFCRCFAATNKVWNIKPDLIALAVIASVLLCVATGQADAADHKVTIAKGSANRICATFHNCYIPEKIAVGTGDTVIWTNVDSEIHTVTSGKLGELDGIFDSGLVKPGESWSFTFYEPGVYDYICTLHPWMVGQVTASGQPMQKGNTTIPEWIKNNARWWADGIITDADFINGIKYLIQHQIIKLPSFEQHDNSNKAIPEWIKNNARWWADGIITDADFVRGIQYMIERGIIEI